MSKVKVEAVDALDDALRDVRGCSFAVGLLADRADELPTGAPELLQAVERRLLGVAGELDGMRTYIEHV